MATVIRHPRAPVPVSVQTRSRASILLELEALHVRRRVLYDELSTAEDVDAGAPRRAPAPERQQSKKAAAGALGMSEKRLTSLCVRYAAAHPGKPKLAVQPAGFKNARWLVYTDRVRQVIESGEPY